MDSNIQRPAEPAVQLHTRFAVISTHGGDKLRLLKFTDAEIAAITRMINLTWPIQDTRSFSFAFEIKLVGYPFDCTHRSTDATRSRILIRDLLAFLFSEGWVLTSPTAMTTRRRDGDTLIFRKQPTPPPGMEWLAIMFCGRDHLRFIGAPRNLIKGIQLLLNDHRLIQNEKLENRAYNSYDIKLRGYPWFPGSSAESVAVREMILGLLESLEKFGWSLYASIEHNSRVEYTSNKIPMNKMDNWYCVKRRDWAPGSPVFHR